MVVGVVAELSVDNSTREPLVNPQELARRLAGMARVAWLSTVADQDDRGPRAAPRAHPRRARAWGWALDREGRPEQHSVRNGPEDAA